MADDRKTGPGGTGASTLVLTYHSVSSAPGPTSIPAEVFARQMASLADSGFQSMTIADMLAWRSGAAGQGRRALITFDDGFSDFESAAAPILAAHGFSAVVFLPTQPMGGRESWRGSNQPARPLMSWSQVADLAMAGIEFGAHGVTHADLTRLAPEARRDEIIRSGEEIAARLGIRTRSFAAPYGRVNADVLREVAAAYEIAFGVRMARPRADDDRVDVPRVDMHYFRDEARWREFLDGGDLYFNARRLLRAVKAAALRLAGNDV